MDATRTRMMVVAVLVCGFAVGMAGLLNYFKYRATANRIVTDRVVVTGKAVESSIQSALSLGLQFADIGTLPGTLERERGTDSLILGIDVFDVDGKRLYSTDRLRASRPVPDSWLAAARRPVNDQWSDEDEVESAAGIVVKNNFGVTIGYLALRYSSQQVRDDALAVARGLAASAGGVFLVSAMLSALAVLWVTRRLNQDVKAVEAALRAGDAQRASSAAVRGPFGTALQRFIRTTQSVEREIATLRERMQRGSAS
jgi:hypothetical protein